MNKQDLEFEMMARKLWCDVYIALIVGNGSHMSEQEADTAYSKFKREFAPIPYKQNRDEKGRFISCV